MHKIIRAAIVGGSTLALAAGIAVVPTVAGAPGSSTGPQAAEAVPYRIPAGTWGRTTYLRDVHVGWYGDARRGERRELRHKTWHAMYYDGKRWYNAVRFDGRYWSSNLLA